jgi:hypothetical protein
VFFDHSSLIFCYINGCSLYENTQISIDHNFSKKNPNEKKVCYFARNRLFTPSIFPEFLKLGSLHLAKIINIPILEQSRG